MAITKKIQFLRNNTIYTGASGSTARDAAIAGMRSIATGSTTSGDIVDGQAILARYNAAGSASTGDVQTIYGIVHKGVNGKTGVTIYESSELLWAAINENVSTSTTISAGTGLSGGGQLNAETVTLRHDTTSRTDNTPIDPTVIPNGGSFTAVTSVGSNTLGHVTGVTTTVFNLPSASDTAVTQEQLTASTSHPIILKVDSGTSASASNKVYYSSGATVDKTGNIKTTGNVSAATVSANNVTAATAVRAGNVSAGTISANTGIRAGNVSAATISAATSIYSPSVSGATISGGSLTASGNVRGGNVSAATISAATSIYSQSVSGVTVSGTTVKGVTISAGTYQNLPVDPDSAVTQANYTADTARPIVLKNGTGTGSVTTSVTFVTAATIDGSGNFSAKTSVSTPSVSATTVSGTTIKGATVSATSYSNLPTASSERDGVVKVVETTGTATGSTVMSQSAVTEAISAALVDVADALVYKGTVSGQSTSPGASLPKADKGDVYKVAVSGYVAGQKVEVGDMFICNTDNTASGTASTNWDVIQNNVDMANYVQTARTVTAGTGLSGGGDLGSDVTIRHQTATVNTLTDIDQTQIGTARTFTAVTGITDDGMGHMSSIQKAIFKLPNDVDSAVTQEQLTASTSHPIILKVDSGTSASANNKVYFSSAATIDKAGNIKTTGNVSGATISGANIYGATAISGANITAATAIRANNVSANTISANTHVKAPTISATTALGVTVSATSAYGVTISAGTGGYKGLPTLTNVVQSGYTDTTARPIVLKNGTGTAQTTGGVAFVTAATINGSGAISGGSLAVTGTVAGTNGDFSNYVFAESVCGGTNVNSPEIYGDYISGGTIEATSTITAPGFSATTSPSTASTDIDASILLSNGKNTNIIDCGTY